MTDLTVDGREWRSPADIYRGLLTALVAPDWHGHNLDALSDSIAGGGINGVEPPYHLLIRLPRRVTPDMERVFDGLASIVAEADAAGRKVQLTLTPSD